MPDLEALSVYDEHLRQVPRDATAVAEASRLAWRALREARRAHDVRAELRLRGYLGSALRILGRFDAAVVQLRAAVRLARAANDDAALTAALIRLGEAHRCRGAARHGARLCAQALALARGDPSLVGYVDFALQHLGKCLLDAGEREAAVACLAEALELRRARGDAALMASTQAALRLARPAGLPDVSQM